MNNTVLFDVLESMLTARQKEVMQIVFSNTVTEASKKLNISKPRVIQHKKAIERKALKAKRICINE